MNFQSVFKRIQISKYQVSIEEREYFKDQRENKTKKHLTSWAYCQRWNKRYTNKCS